MGQIYSSASRVVIWLGRDTFNMAETAFELICATLKHEAANRRNSKASGARENHNYEESLETDGKFDRAKPGETPPRLELGSPEYPGGPVNEDLDTSNSHTHDSQEPYYLRGNSVEPVYVGEFVPLIQAEFWDSLRVFWQNSWFERTWIIQEIALSSHGLVMWGSAAIYWEWVHLATTIMSQGILGTLFDQYTENALAIFSTMRFSYVSPAERDKPKTFLDLLQGAHSFQASDPRDKIYGLLGLDQAHSNLQTNSPAKLFVEPDYTIPVAQLYTCVARRLLEEYQSLDLLLCICHDHELHNYDDPPPLNLPSWVSDWSRSPRARPFGLYHKRSPRGSAKVRPQLNFISEGCLCVTGAKVAQVREVLPILRSQPAGNIHRLDAKIISAIDECLTRGVSLFALYDTLTTRMLELHYSMLLHQNSEEVSYSIVWQMAFCEFNAFLRHEFGESRYHEICREHGLELGPRGGHDAFDSVAVKWCDGRRLFFIDDGIIGTGPAATKADDVIYFFDGSTFPFVIRKEGDQYRFIGACYVAGLEQKDEESCVFLIV
jgi:hypothetical protein